MSAISSTWGLDLERPGRSSSRSSGTLTDQTRALGTRLTTIFARPKDDLLPMVDQASSALILDLELRGLLDEALVMVIRDHGHTPLTDRKARGEAATTRRALLPGLCRWRPGPRPLKASIHRPGCALAFHFEFGLGVQRQRPPVSARKPMASWWQISWASSRWSGVCKNGCPFRLAVENVCEGDSTSTESEPQCRFRAESRLNTEGRSRAGLASTDGVVARLEARRGQLRHHSAVEGVEGRGERRLDEGTQGVDERRAGVHVQRQVRASSAARSSRARVSGCGRPKKSSCWTFTPASLG